MERVSASSSKAGRRPELTEGEHFGSCLRRAREARALTIGDVAAATKVPRSCLEQVESSDLAHLPAEVFVRGFIRAYARAVGIAETEPLGLYDRAIKAASEAKRAQSAKPVVDPTMAGLDTAGAPFVDDDREGGHRRGLGLAVFVIILLLIATITLSLLLRRPPVSGEGLSSERVPAGATSIAVDGNALPGHETRLS